MSAKSPGFFDAQEHQAKAKPDDGNRWDRWQAGKVQRKQKAGGGGAAGERGALYEVTDQSACGSEIHHAGRQKQA